MSTISPAFPLPRTARLFGALPDALTAAGCLLVWIAPMALGAGAVKTVVLMMLMEFLLVHGTGFFTVVAFMDSLSKTQRLLAMGGLLLFYALFVGVFAWTFSAWWPVWVFAWLVLAKAAWIFATPRSRERELGRQMVAWAFSVAAYLAAVAATLILPIPHLGIDAALVPSLGLPGSGEWIERPHTAVAGMVLYYLAQAGFKYWYGGRSDADARIAAAAATTPGNDGSPQPTQSLPQVLAWLQDALRHWAGRGS